MVQLNKIIEQLKRMRNIVRITVVGDGAVGKTTLVQAILRLTQDCADDPPITNFMETKKIKRTPFMEIESWNYKDLLIQCYDLAGQRSPGAHPLDILQNQVISSIDIFIFVFSVDRYESFENLNNWITLMHLNNSYTNKNSGLILVGNKIDLNYNVSKEFIQSIVGETKYFQSYIETSATKGIGIDELLDEIANTGKNLLDANMGG
ncbi:MAG: GTPase domain-containing protein [Candidatus Hodarchaeota archaeon]